MTKTGKVLVAFSDGCVGKSLDAKANCLVSTATASNTLTQHGGVVRQVSGKGLFAAYDPTSARTPNGGGSGSGGGGSEGGTDSGGSLSDTGSTPWLPIGGLLLLVVAAGSVALRRRQTAS